ncbi:hypothetical protein HY641_01325 [Candidatus Woesearchaeota archaeon]|nr:hypothetical protein [Candidatus Woesearchaeota archaeon]
MSNEVYGLLTDRKGGYMLLGPSIATSRFQGWYLGTTSAPLRVIESLHINEELSEVSTALTSIQRRYATITEDLGYVRGLPAIAQRLSKKTSVELIIDGKRIDDHREWGRRYTIHHQDGIVLVEFQKKEDEKEPRDGEYQWWLAIASEDLHLLPQEQWIEHAYTYDQERASPPFKRYVFFAATINAREVVYAVGQDKESAFTTAKEAWAKRESAWKVHDRLTTVHPKGEINHAYHAARHALCSLLGPQGLQAGLPWFHQVWSRDAAISLPALMMIGHEQDAKRIALELLKNIGDDGLVPIIIHPKSTDRCFDAAGWLFFSLHFLIERHPRLFSQDEIDTILSTLHSAISTVKSLMQKDDFIETPNGMSWMDASYGGDTRLGARIEHQALFLAMLKFQRVHGRKNGASEKEFAAKVRYHFFKNHYLYDGKDDPMIRPNVFLAHHVYPELLTNSEWEQCFDRVLTQLWLPWGGLSSIDTQHKLFTGHHTGENPQSYHRGDSWYWINNLAAISLEQVNKKKYASYIIKILNASTKDILTLGALGHHSELSSALSQTGQGCMSQAWSAAMYVELVNSIT